MSHTTTVTDLGSSTALSHACEPADVAGTPASTAEGTKPSSRLIGIDTARGIALFGMMAVHTLDLVSASGDMSLAWALAAGKSAALFAVLAGVGIAFTSGRTRPPRGRAWTAIAASLVARAAVLLAVGLLLGHVVDADTAAVILPYYALLFVLAIPLLQMSIRALVVLAAVIAVGGPFLSYALRDGAPSDVPNFSFSELVQDPSGTLSGLFLTGVYPALPWLAYLCVGLAVGRAVISSRRVMAQITVIGIALALGASTLSWVLLDGLGGRAQLEQVALQSMTVTQYTDLLVWGAGGTLPTDTPWWLATLAPHSSTPLDMAYTIGIALAVLGACMVLGLAGRRVFRPVAAAGSMTFTLYTAHLLMISPPLAGFMPEDSTISWLVQIVVLVAFALVWSRYRARGPIEDVVWRVSGAVRRTVMAAGTKREDDRPGRPFSPERDRIDAPRERSTSSSGPAA